MAVSEKLLAEMKKCKLCVETVTEGGIAIQPCATHTNALNGKRTRKAKKNESK